MIVGSIARRYAKALFSLADEQGQVEQWSLGLDALGQALQDHPELRDTYFGHYTEVVLYTQTTDPGVVEAGRRAAERLGLDFRHVHVGIDGLEAAIPVSFRALSSRGSKE